jgi:hypothetical protein
MPDAMIGASLQENDVSCMHYICKTQKKLQVTELRFKKKLMP